MNPQLRRRLGHAALILLGWVVFVWGWFHVTAARPEIGELRVLLVAALLVVPVLTLTWVAHNVGIYRRKGPRRAVRAIELDYPRDFNGRFIRADWAALQAARVIEIGIDDENDKCFLPVAAGDGAASRRAAAAGAGQGLRPRTTA